MKPAIRVDGLSKVYRRGPQKAASYRTLREAIGDAARAPFRRLRERLRPSIPGGATGPGDAFYALRDVSLEIQPGELVGVIGPNGAGKSTLLKILSRITEPTDGRVEVRGRMGSLLEVGTGFHPELTGRENVYLNGSILGMSRREIDRKFDAIVAFSEVEAFLDTPVKRYSSGMFVRLAFAVAAHLEPEILVIDEVLAVGDAQFQRKCLGKMEDVAHDGRTVIFVSHQMASVQRLCTRAVLLQGGQATYEGKVSEAVGRYLNSDSLRQSEGDWIDLSGARRRGNLEARFTAFRCAGRDAARGNGVYPDAPVEIVVRIESDAPRSVSSLAVSFYDRYGTRLVNADTLAIGHPVSLAAGSNEVRLLIESLHLNPGDYTVGFWLARHSIGSHPTILDFIESGGRVEVLEYQSEGFGRRPDCDGVVTSPFRVLC